VAQQGRSWDDVPEEIKNTFDKLGIPEAEKKFLAGVKAQYESEVVYGSLKEDLAKQGVIFTDMDSALREYPDLVRQYFSTIIPPTDNKFAALNSAVWSGGSFVYVPPGVKIEFPLQAYFRINAAKMGQFERTLIIVDEGAQVHYVEGCTAPMYSSESLHAAIVEVIGKPGSRVRYTTIQNWANNIYNLVTKRAVAYQDALIEWVDGNLGSRLTMKYPSIYMLQPGARGDVLSVAFASAGQHQDAGAKVVHCAPHTSSRIVSKSISKNGGRTSDLLYKGALQGSSRIVWRGMIKVDRDAQKTDGYQRNDNLMLSETSRADSIPGLEIEADDVKCSHGATAGRVDDEQVFYAATRGLSRQEAIRMIVNGFFQQVFDRVTIPGVRHALAGAIGGRVREFP
jgi:Fe-S cluster assembly protein SufB